MKANRFDKAEPNYGPGALTLFLTIAFSSKTLKVKRVLGHLEALKFEQVQSNYWILLIRTEPEPLKTGKVFANSKELAN